MTWDWKALAPHRPLREGEGGLERLYVARASGGADDLDKRLDAGFASPMALFGPVGVGKSTELAALAARRQAKWIGAMVRLEEHITFTARTTADDVLDAIARAAIVAAHEGPKLRLSDAVERLLHVDTPSQGGIDLLLATVREIRAASRQGEVGLLIDGLEKTSADLASQVLTHLVEVRGEVRVVVVVPVAVATGPAASVLEDYEPISLGPVVTRAEGNGPERAQAAINAVDGQEFLLEIARRRLGVASLDAVEAVARECARRSGGVVRTFLQLLEKAALYANMRGRPAPESEDVERAARDQSAFLQRLLKEGDAAALRAAEGTDGSEIPLDRRIRFLAAGLLLEYEVDSRRVVHAAPLLAPTLQQKSERTGAARG